MATYYNFKEGEYSIYLIFSEALFSCLDPCFSLSSSSITKEVRKAKSWFFMFKK